MNRRPATTQPSHWRWAMASVVVLLLGSLLVACGDDDETDEGPAAGPQGGAESVEPQPQPLEEQTTVRVQVGARFEPFIPLFLAQRFGEFEKENLDVQVELLPSSDALPLLLQGELDVSVTSLSAGLFNAAQESGGEIQMVAPNNEIDERYQGGLWASSDLLVDGELDPAQLEGQTIGTAVGEGAILTLPIVELLEEGGLTLDDVSLEQFPADQLPTALENDAIAAGWFEDPFYLQVQEFAEFVRGMPIGSVGGGYVFGPNLLGDNRPVGEAFIRALMRATRAYLQDDYKANDEVAEAIAEELEQPVETIRQTPSLYFNPDLTLPAEIPGRLQEAYADAGVLGYPDPVPDDELYEEDFVDAAAGR